jgi:FtsH-binding integral membrane protein
MNPNMLTAEEIRLEQASFMTKVYMWMCGALMVTAATAMLVASTPALLEIIFGNRLVFYALLIGEVLLVGYISAAMGRLSASTATLLFAFYSFLNGVTLAAIFVVFTSASLASTFFITAGTFGE